MPIKGEACFRSFHQGLIDFEEMESSRCPDTGTFLYKALNIIRALRSTSWETTEKVLESYRQAVKYSSGRGTLDTDVWGHDKSSDSDSDSEI